MSTTTSHAIHFNHCQAISYYRLSIRQACMIGMLCVAGSPAANSPMLVPQLGTSWNNKKSNFSRSIQGKWPSYFSFPVTNLPMLVPQLGTSWSSHQTLEAEAGSPAMARRSKGTAKVATTSRCIQTCTYKHMYASACACDVILALLRFSSPADLVLASGEVAKLNYFL